MPDVVFYEVFEEEKEAIKKLLSKDVKARFIAQTTQEQGRAFPPAKVISVRTHSRIPLSWAPHLKGILTRSQGYDHLVSYCRQSGIHIPCGYLGDYCSRAVAEQAVLVMMALLRQLKKQIHAFETFSRDHLTGAECRGRHALIVGVGRIGSQIVDIVQGLRMEVKGVDIAPQRRDLEYVSLKEGLRWADAVFCACCLTEKTQGMLDYRALRKAKKGFLLINVARGEIAPVKDLERLFCEGVLGGLSLDVYEQESAVADYFKGHHRLTNGAIKTILKLKDRDDVLFTPHNAFNTQEALEAKARLSAQAVRYFLQKGTFPLAVPHC